MNPHPNPGSGKWAVNEWGSDPEAGNDDCYSGQDYEGEAVARAAFQAVVADGTTEGEEFWFSLEDPDGKVVAKHCLSREPVAAKKKRAEAEDASWRNEIAMEAGMLGGCSAYNEAMGWDTE